MIKSILDNINKSNADAMESDVTVETLVFKLNNNRYSLIKNRLY